MCSGSVNHNGARYDLLSCFNCTDICGERSCSTASAIFWVSG